MSPSGVEARENRPMCRLIIVIGLLTLAAHACAFAHLM
jgi:hypothetical protein